MKGTRPLTNTEILKVAECFDGTFAVRNRSLFMLGVSTGGRISELLSLRVGDVWQNQRPVTDLLFTKNIVKGGEQSRAVPMNADAIEAVNALIHWYQDGHEKVFMTEPAMLLPLFPSRNASNGGLKPMRRNAAAKMLKLAFEAAGLNGKLATHSLRKSFAQRLYEQTTDIFAVQEMLGHKSVSTTQDYLGVNYGSVKAALEAMAVAAGTEPKNATPIFKATDDELIVEILKRGYNVSAAEQLADTKQD